MAALSQATIIIEAGETSGTLVQARHALKQGRKLFILESNFKNSSAQLAGEIRRTGCGACALNTKTFESTLPTRLTKIDDGARSPYRSGAVRAQPIYH